MKVSIVMNSYFEDRINLVDAVNSCLAQEDVEVDFWLSMVEGDPNILFAREQYKGINICVLSRADHGGRSVKACYRQINNALPHLTGDWFMFISSNDILLKRKCITEILCCMNNKKLICYSSYLRADLNSGKIRYSQMTYWNYSIRKHLEGNYVADCSLVHMEVAKRYFPFNTEFNNYNFWDFWLRIYKGEGDIFCYNPAITWIYQVTKKSMSRERTNAERKQFKFDEERMLAQYKYEKWLQ